MSWIQKHTPRTVRITRKLAEEWSRLPELRQDRPLREARLMAHRKTLAAGRFRPVTWASAYVKSEKKTLRLNGMHTSTLFASVELEKFQPLHAVIETYECDTLEDAAELFATFDSMTQARTQGELNRSFAATVTELKDFDGSFINAVVSGVNFFRRPTAKGAVGKDGSPAERAEILFQDHEVEFAQWLHRMIAEGQTTNAYHLRRAGVTAAMRATWGKSRTAATEFWTLVRDDTGKHPDTPDRRLSRWLREMRVSFGKGAATAPLKFQVPGREFYARCLAAWNLWRKGQTGDLKYRQADPLPTAV
jgi:hypothetical protein